MNCNYEQIEFSEQQLWTFCARNVFLFAITHALLVDSAIVCWQSRVV